VNNPYVKKRPVGLEPLPFRVSQPTPSSSEQSGDFMSEDMQDPTEGTRYARVIPAASASAAVGGDVGPKPSNKRTASELLRPNPYARKSLKSNGCASGVGTGNRPAKAKAPASRILNPEERRMLLEPLSPTMPVFDRFFCALLRSTPAEYRSTFASDGKASDLWRTICQRVSVPVPNEPLPSRYPVDKGDVDGGGAGANLHFDHRAALVLEEARQAIAQGLVCPQGASGRGVGGAKSSSAVSSMVLPVHNVETTNTMGTLKLTFVKRSEKFKPDELSLLRPGNVVELRSRDFFSHPAESSSVLAVLTSTNREQIEKSRQFQCLVFDPTVCIKQGQDWKMQIVASCISECRCFEAMTSATVRKSELVSNLLGHHKRDERGDEIPPAKKCAKSMASFFDRHPSELNETQELASRAFLESAPNSITLIQGSCKLVCSRLFAAFFWR
jgi:hypothetical protein